MSDFLVIFGSIISIIYVVVLVHILRNHLRGGVRAMIILITQGGGTGGDVQNWAKVDYVISARSHILHCNMRKLECQVQVHL